MKNIVMVNPSPNMLLLAGQLKKNAVNVRFVSVPKVFIPEIDSLWWHSGTKRFHSSSTLPDEMKPVDSNIAMIKKPFFTKYRYRYLSQALADVDENMKNGTFKDHVVLGRRLIKADNSVDFERYGSMEEVLSTFSSYIILTSEIHNNNGQIRLDCWENDFDIDEAFGKDYHVFFKKNKRIELFAYENKLYSFGPRDMNVDILKDFVPSFKKFNFNSIKSYYINRNENPWIAKYSNRVYLINDYSVGSASVALPDAWVKAVCKFLCTEKQQ